jgi:hypothetical protein
LELAKGRDLADCCQLASCHWECGLSLGLVREAASWGRLEEACGLGLEEGGGELLLLLRKPVAWGC